MFVPLWQGPAISDIIFYRKGAPAPSESQLEFQHPRNAMAPHREDVAAVKGSAHRDADEEALQAALQESLDQKSSSAARNSTGSNSSIAAWNELKGPKSEEKQREEDSGDDEEAAKTSSYTRVPNAVVAEKPQKSEEDEEEEDPNEDHKLLNFADILLIDILKWLDEDTIGAAAAAARNKFGLRRFPTWFDMFHERPRVRYNGFYWLQVSYYKKPELSMWSEIVPGTILKCIYYRYFSFQRDGTVLYGMLFKAPHEVEAHIRNQRKGVYRGRFYVDKDELVVTVPTNCNEVNFRLKITQRERGKNVKLVLKEHFANSEPDGSGWVNYYDTADEEFYYYRSWNLQSQTSNSERSPDLNTHECFQPEENGTIQAHETPSSAKSSTRAAASSATEQVKKKPTSAYPLPSSTLHKHKQASVFTSGKKKYKTNFSSAYDSGSIPCRINHGSIRNSLQWTKDPNSELDFKLQVFYTETFAYCPALSYEPLLITCIEGFLETEHPFVFLARATFRELLKLEDAREKTLPILAQVIVPLRGALMAKDDDTFLMGLEATRLLSDLVEGEMNLYLSKLTQQIHRKLLTKQLRVQVEDTLAVLESNGGKEALAIIRSKIPTYVSIR
ncbi:Parkin co-regulated protein [Phytophthora cactorum]|nr:Parkin co-regulated protein [Phytophthora cactorum]